MAILSFHSKSNKFTELLEENKLKFYKIAKIILKIKKNEKYKNLLVALIDRIILTII